MKRYWMTALLALVVSVATLPAFAAEDITALLNEGMTLYKAGNLTKAAQVFESATVQAPDNVVAWYNLGAIQYELKHYEQARVAFQKAVWRNPNDADARISLAWAQEAMGMKADALTNLQRVPATSARFNEALQKANGLQQELARIQTQATTTVATAATKVQPVSHAVAAVATSVAPSVAGQRQVVLTTALAGPTGMAAGPNGDLYIANYSKNSVVVMNAQGKVSTLASGTGLMGPIGLVRDARNGNLYVANYLKGNVVRISPNGQLKQIADGFGKPYYLFLDTLHNQLFVTEQEGNLVSKVKL